MDAALRPVDASLTGRSGPAARMLLSSVAAASVVVASTCHPWTLAVRGSEGSGRLPFRAWAYHPGCQSKWASHLAMQGETRAAGARTCPGHLSLWREVAAHMQDTRLTLDNSHSDLWHLAQRTTPFACAVSRTWEFFLDRRALSEPHIR